MEMFEFIMIDLAILLAIKMIQFICNVFKKNFHNNVWAKSFWKEFFQSPLIMVVVIHHDELPSWNFDGFTFLSKCFFWLVWASSITCHVCNWLSSNSTNSKFFCFTIPPCRNPTLAKCGGEAQHSQCWGLGVLRDSRMFRVRQQGPKHLALGCYWCHWKGLEA
jgi:hypothetical protein